MIQFYEGDIIVYLSYGSYKVSNGVTKKYIPNGSIYLCVQPLYDNTIRDKDNTWGIIPIEDATLISRAYRQLEFNFTGVIKCNTK